MALETVTYPHIDCSDPRKPVIAGKNFKLIHLIREHVAYGWSAEELALNHPQLTLGEIYSALAYYSDHRAEINLDIASTEGDAEQMHADPRHTRLAARIKNSA